MKVMDEVAGSYEMDGKQASLHRQRSSFIEYRGIGDLFSNNDA
jgi:hypothetical protein